MLAFVLASALAFGVFGCQVQPSAASRAAVPPPVLEESWKAYVSRFIQSDGRVIDRRAGNISTSEGQSYAMLRAVWIGDKATFDKTYAWGRNNLNSQVRGDHLWAWKWGKSADGHWQVLDKAFATDADQDVALALILAYKVWNKEQYLQDARAILSDLWNSATTEIGGRRFLLAGDSLCKDSLCRLNPSYYAPYSYRVFAKFDNTHNWPQLIDSSYFVLDTASGLTQTGLPPDWLVMDTRTGQMRLSGTKDSAFSYDAFRVYWRLAMDRDVFHEERAARYIQRTLPTLVERWRRQGMIAAAISAKGEALVPYESLEMIAAVMPAVAPLDPDAARAMAQHLESAYAAGIWGDKESYYLQNWGWFGTALYDNYLGPFQSLLA